jgi:hypothetical protein
MTVGAAAQITTGSILGRVEDSSGSAVPKASVTVINTGTSFSQTAFTNESGEYLVPALPVGSYRVSVSHAGFKSFHQEGVLVEINRAARLDVRLEVGAISESVNVSADATLVDTTQSSVSQIVEQTRIAELPLSGRNTAELVRLTPGVVTLDTQSSLGYTEYRISANGANFQQVQVLLDGGSNTSPFRNTGNALPNPDAVQEFRVMFSNMSAEYGRLGLGVVNTITKSGTNSFRFSLFEFLRNRAITARQWNTPSVNPLVQNQFGGSAGGRIRRDRTFFFTSYQQLERRTVAFRNVAIVPSALERAGNFSASRTKPRVPGTTQPFPNDTIPASQFDAVSRNLLNQYIPVANTADGRYEFQAPAPSGEKQILIKLDHFISSGQRLAFNYFASSTSLVENIVSGGDLPYAIREFPGLQQNVGLAHTWTLNPRWLNALRLGYIRSTGQRISKPEKSLADLGGRWTPDSVAFLPELMVPGFFNLRTQFTGPTFSNQYELKNAISAVLGRHTVKFGGEAIHIRDTNKTGLSSNGAYTFNGSISGVALSDFLLGRAASFAVSNQFSSYRNHSIYALFAQDDLRATRNLTLNLGLRWEVSTPVIHPHDLTGTFSPGQRSDKIPLAPPGLVFPGDSGIPKGLRNRDLNSFGPRFGFAWDVFGDAKTSVRGGYGIYFSELTSNQQGGDTQPPFAFNTTYFDVQLSDPWAKVGRSLLPFIFNPQNPLFIFPMNVTYTHRNFRAPYFQQYNLTIQRQVKQGLLVEAGYVGNAGRKLRTQISLNNAVFIPGGSTTANIQQRRPILPQYYGDIAENRNLAKSHYDALQISVTKRLSSGLTFVANYVYSKVIDLPDANALDPYRYQLDRGRGLLDLRHNFVSSFVWEPVWTHGFQGPAKVAFDGWQLSGILSFNSGLPFTLTAGQDINLDGIINDRPNLNGDPRLDPNRSREAVSQRWFDVSKFSPPAPGAYGTAGRNILTSPGFKNLDLGAAKNFRLTERHHLQFRGEFFNLFNWVNLSAPVTNVRAATAGRILTAGSPRVIQFGLKYQF